MGRLSETEYRELEYAYLKDQEHAAQLAAQHEQTPKLFVVGRYKEGDRVRFHDTKQWKDGTLMGQDRCHRCIVIDGEGFVHLTWYQPQGATTNAEAGDFVAFLPLTNKQHHGYGVQPVAKKKKR